MPTARRQDSGQQGARVTVQAVNWSACCRRLSPSKDVKQQEIQQGEVGSKSLRLENCSSFPFGIVVVMRRGGGRDPGSPRGAGNVAGLRLGTRPSRISAPVIPLLIVAKVRLGDSASACCCVPPSCFISRQVRRGIRRFRDDDIITPLPGGFKRGTWRPPRPPSEPTLSRRKGSRTRPRIQTVRSDFWLSWFVSVCLSWRRWRLAIVSD